MLRGYCTVLLYFVSEQYGEEYICHQADEHAMLAKPYKLSDKQIKELNERNKAYMTPDPAKEMIERILLYRAPSRKPSL